MKEIVFLLRTVQPVVYVGYDICYLTTAANYLNGSS